ncbi:MAG: histidine--tRNA ligase [Bacteroidetes bacterium]|nr:histidine--tRNA ligase [Bacteroidota bacterium]
MKPSTPKGTRDFSPTDVAKRNYIFHTIKSTFTRYGFDPIETPAMENLSTLMGKYGEEGDKLLFKILNSGEILEKLRSKTDELKIGDITEKGLRYDLTVPFARYVVQHQNEITFPFKRYQIQPVWRADRPQKGRYREFYQCDADVIGSESLLNEIELVKMIDDVFSTLKLPVIIKLNNRKILSGLAEVIGEQEKIIDITVAIDKLDKIGIEGVNKELTEKGISNQAIEKLQPIINFAGDYIEKIELLSTILAGSAIGLRGIEEIKYVFEKIANCELQTATCELDITLARGLNYYTGAIVEVKANLGTLKSSICGGGRYDDLTGIFGLPNLSGVGISFGIDRIFDVLEEANLFADVKPSNTKVLIICFSEQELDYGFQLLLKLRNASINSELYPDRVKVKKQFEYANKKNIPYCIVIGSEEMASGQLSVKNMQSGEQEKLTIDNLLLFLNR